MATTEKKVPSPSKQLRKTNYARIKELSKELETEIFVTNHYDPTQKDLLCINFVQNQTILEQNQTILEKLEKIESNISLKEDQE